MHEKNLRPLRASRMIHVISTSHSPPLPHARRFARAARGPFAARHRLLWVSASIQGLSRIPLLIFIHWGSLVSVHSRGCAPGGSLRRGPIHQMWRPADAAWEEWSLFGKATALGAISSLSLFFPSPWAPRAAALEQLRILGGHPYRVYLSPY